MIVGDLVVIKGAEDDRVWSSSGFDMDNQSIGVLCNDDVGIVVEVVLMKSGGVEVEDIRVMTTSVLGWIDSMLLLGAL